MELRRVPRLVPLQVSDEMPSDGSSYGIHFFERLLDAVLADVLESSSTRRLDCFRAMSLGHGDNRHALLMPTSLHGGVDSTSDLPQSLRQVRKTHNVPSYLRLQSEASEST